jgi:hypothetical protein
MTTDVETSVSHKFYHVCPPHTHTVDDSSTNLNYEFLITLIKTPK